VTKAEAYFERALAVARQQQAKSWELRPAMSMWRASGAIRGSVRDARCHFAMGGWSSALMFRLSLV
jgi:hypothetical protein